MNFWELFNRKESSIIKKKSCILTALLLFVLLFYHKVHAQDGNGAQTEFDLGVTYTADLFSNLTGGLEQGVRFMDNIDVELNYTWKTKPNRGKTQLYFYGLGNQGGSISELTEDVQGISNIEAESSWRIYEAWIQKNILPLKTSLLVGLYDVNTEFDVINTGSLFINSSHGIGAEFASSGVLGPSIFPYTSLAARIKTNPLKGLVLKFAALDGIPSNPQNTDGTKIYFRARDGLLFAGEIALFSSESGTFGELNSPTKLHHFLGRSVSGDQRYKLAVGAWKYSKKRTGWISDGHRDKGAYLLGEYRLFSENSTEFQGLSGFFRLGMANEKVNIFKGYMGGGFVYTGLFKDRTEDQFGVAVAVPLASDDYIDLQERSDLSVKKFEMNIETTYQFMVGSSSFFQLDVQYIINPGLLGNRKNALAAGVRASISL